MPPSQAQQRRLLQYFIRGMRRHPDWPVLISEVHYNPPGDGDETEFIELVNISQGNDAVALRHDGAIVDVIGQAGVDPGDQEELGNVARGPLSDGDPDRDPEEVGSSRRRAELPRRIGIRPCHRASSRSTDQQNG